MTKPILSKQCSITNCERDHIARSFCAMHYQRWRNKGTPGEAGVQLLLGVGDTEEERFWSRVSKDGPLHPTNAELGRCWLWLGRIAKGYGNVKLNGKQERTHRQAWFYTYGEMPAKWILHSCDNTKCVNPDHLREGSPKENSQDMLSRNRQACGERLPQTKLTASQVIDIRKRYAEGGFTKTALGLVFGVGRTTIRDIIRRNRWKHI